MSDKPLIELPFEPKRHTHHREIVFNADRWARIAREELPEELGFFFMMIPKNGELPVLRTDLPKEQLRRALKKMLSRLNDFDVSITTER